MNKFILFIFTNIYTFIIIVKHLFLILFILSADNWIDIERAPRQLRLTTNYIVRHIVYYAYTRVLCHYMVYI